MFNMLSRPQMSKNWTYVDAICFNKIYNIKIVDSSSKRWEYWMQSANTLMMSSKEIAQKQKQNMEKKKFNIEFLNLWAIDKGVKRHGIDP